MSPGSPVPKSTIPPYFMGEFFPMLRKKSASDLCKLCRGRQTTEHVLSICKVGLDSGRFTWRHNCVINFIVNSIDEKYTVYSDLAGHTAPGGGSIALCDFNFLPFEKVRSSDPFVIEARESYWIEKYGVLGEGGMNRRS